MAYIRVTKPVGGRVSVEYDDTRGRTGMHKYLADVPVGDALTAVSAWADQYLATRERLRAARKAVVP